VQLELLLLTSISNSINELVAIGSDEDLAFECGYGIERMQFFERLFGEGVNRLKFVEMLLDLDTVVNA